MSPSAPDAPVGYADSATEAVTLQPGASPPPTRRPANILPPHIPQRLAAEPLWSACVKRRFRGSSEFSRTSKAEQGANRPHDHHPPQPRRFLHPLAPSVRQDKAALHAALHPDTSGAMRWMLNRSRSSTGQPSRVALQLTFPARCRQQHAGFASFPIMTLQAQWGPHASSVPPSASCRRFILTAPQHSPATPISRLTHHLMS
jgi:hypothetical protein